MRFRGKVLSHCLRMVPVFLFSSNSWPVPVENSNVIPIKSADHVNPGLSEALHSKTIFE